MTRARRWAALGLIALVVTAWDPRRDAAADPYTVAGVAVDETAADATAARDKAMDVGQRAAWETLVRRITAPGDADRALGLDAQTVGALVSSFEVFDEKVPVGRYIAKLTFRFNGLAVRRALQGLGITHFVAESPPVLVLPVLETGDTKALFELDNPWRDAWQSGAGGAGLVPVVVPIGDLRDIAAIDAERAVAGDADALAAIAARYGTGSVAVVAARADAAALAPSKVDVALTLRRGRRTNVEAATYELPEGVEPTAEALFAVAVAGTLGRLDESWRMENLVESGVSATLKAEVPVASLADWLDVERRLGSVGLVRAVAVDVMGAKAVTVALTYGGDTARLASALEAAGLELVREADLWILRRTSAANTSDAPAAGGVVIE